MTKLEHRYRAALAAIYVLVAALLVVGYQYRLLLMHRQSQQHQQFAEQHAEQVIQTFRAEYQVRMAHRSKQHLKVQAAINATRRQQEFIRRHLEEGSHGLHQWPYVRSTANNSPGFIGGYVAALTVNAGIMDDYETRLRAYEAAYEEPHQIYPSARAIPGYTGPKLRKPGALEDSR